MKTFRVVLSVGGAIFVEADRHETAEGFVKFYRGDSVIAEYPATSVREDVEERTLTQKIPLFALHSEPPPPPAR